MLLLIQNGTSEDEKTLFYLRGIGFYKTPQIYSNIEAIFKEL